MCGAALCGVVMYCNTMHYTVLIDYSAGSCELSHPQKVSHHDVCRTSIVEWSILQAHYKANHVH